MINKILFLQKVSVDAPTLTYQFTPKKTKSKNLNPISHEKNYLLFAVGSHRYIIDFGNDRKAAANYDEFNPWFCF